MPKCFEHFDILIGPFLVGVNFCRPVSVFMCNPGLFDCTLAAQPSKAAKRPEDEEEQEPRKENLTVESLVTMSAEAPILY
jgi:hypothetical protein